MKIAKLPPCARPGLFLLAVLLALLPLALQAASVPVKTPRTEARLIADVQTIKAGQPFWAMLHVALQPGWHTYWKNPGDSGTPPILAWTLPSGFTSGEAQFLPPERHQVETLVDYGYSDNAYYLVQITPPPLLSGKAVSILMLKAQWLVCKDVCIPEKGEFSLALPATDGDAEPSGDAAMIASAVQQLPQPVGQDVAYRVEENEVRFTLPVPQAPGAGALFFPAHDGIIANTAQQQTQWTAEGLAFRIGRGSEPELVDFEGVVSLALEDGTRRDYAVKLLGPAGAAAEKMPEPIAPPAAAPIAAPVAAAQPVAPLPPAAPGITLWDAIWFALLGGLILNAMPCVFPVLSLKALAVAKKAALHPARARVHGVAYTAGVLASFMALAFALVALQQSGASIGWGYQMQSPVFVSLLAMLLFLVGLNLAGFFELPVLLGNVGGDKAAQDNASGSFFTGVLAVAVATPCTAPFMAPAIGYALTQSSAIIFAVFGALGLGLASPFLLISLFPGLVKAMPKPGLWMITFKQFLAFPMLGWAVWLLWVLGRLSGVDVASLTLLCMVGIAFAIWLWGRGGVMPRFLSLLMFLAALAVTVAAASMPMNQQALGAHASSVAFDPARIEALRAEGKPLFVDATADWCLTCKINEAAVLSKPATVELFRQRGVTFMVADYTHGDEAITRYLDSFGRSGVPIYVYYPPRGEPVVLPQLLTYDIVKGALDGAH